MNLRGHTDDAILSDVRGLIGAQRELTARLIVYLAEIERRRLHLLAGFSSMFDFCVKELRLSEGEAFRRLVAARLNRKYPVIHGLVASGEVHLSALALLRPHLNEENHVELLEATRGKSKRDVELLLATRFPRPDEPARMRATSPERVRFEFTASAALREKLERCLYLSSHANPSRDLGFVVERAVELLLAKLERERLGKAKRPHLRAKIARASARANVESRSVGPPNAESLVIDSPSAESPGAASPSEVAASRHVANPVRRLVFERDGCRCTYVSPDGHRCEATAFLELDHVIPHALGGRAEPENLRVRCRAHNRLWAEQTFGRAHVERAVHFRQRKYHEPTENDARLQPTRAADASFGVHEKVVLALKRMGFRRAHARSAVFAAEKRVRVEGPHALEALLREALREATKAA
jgi:hypothetical protein